MFRKTTKPTAEELMAELLAQSTKEQSAKESPPKKSDLELKVSALWRLMQEKLNLTDQDLQECMLRIEKEDSEQNLSEPAVTQAKCPKCGRTVLAKTGICIYCGKAE